MKQHVVTFSKAQEERNRKQLEKYKGKFALMETYRYRNPIVFHRLEGEVNKLRKALVAKGLL